MSPGRWINDSFLLGLVSGIITLALFYFSIDAFRLLLIEYLEDPYVMKPPTVHLISIVLNIVIFRILIVNYEKEKTGKGYLFITVVLALSYFYFFFKIARQ